MPYKIPIAPNYDAEVAEKDHTHSGSGFQFPVGWILISAVDVNPLTFLGYGTWIKTATGKMLVGVDTGDSDFNTVEKIGGGKSVIHAGSAVGNHPATPTSQASAGATQRGTTSSTLTLLAHTIHQYFPMLLHNLMITIF